MALPDRRILTSWEQAKQNFGNLEVVREAAAVPKTLYLVRHGETDANRLGVIQGQRAPAALTTLGQRQMERGARFLKKVLSSAPLIWRSPTERAGGAASIFKTLLSGEVRETPQLLQRSWGAHEGLTVSALAGDTESAYYSEPGKLLATDAETLESVKGRLSLFKERLLDCSEDEHIVLSHNELLNYLMNLLTQLWLHKRSIQNGEVIRLRLDEGGNITGRPKSIFPRRKVAVWHDAPSFLRAEHSLKLLRNHDLDVASIKNVRSSASKNAVVAIVLGDSKFGFPEAQEYPKLKVISRFGSGTSAIVVPEICDKGIKIARVPAVNAHSVATFSVAVGILLLRESLVHADGLRRDPPVWRMATEMGLDIRDATFGIIGLGHIGLETARVARLFNTHLIAYNRSWPVGLKRAARVLDIRRASSIESVLTNSDVISLHVELTEATRHLLNRPRLELVRAAGRRPVIVNTSRGDVVDESALLDALNSGWVRAAALDVWSMERDQVSEVVTKLRHHPCVLPTPHIAGYTSGTIDRVARQCAYNIVAAVEMRLSEVDELIVT